MYGSVCVCVCVGCVEMADDRLCERGVYERAVCERAGGSVVHARMS